MKGLNAMRNTHNRGAMLSRARQLATPRSLLATTGAAALAGTGLAVWALRDIPRALGNGRAAARDSRVRRSLQFHGGAFHNPQRVRMFSLRTARSARETGSGLRELIGDAGCRPFRPIPPPPRESTPVNASDLAVTWYGHASALVEIDGARVLIDPIWSQRCSPSARVGPRRMHEPPIRLEDLPTVDAVVISHDHYDHLDVATVDSLARHQEAPFVVPLGVGAHLRRWDVPEHRIVELDWDEHVDLAGLTLTATPAQHFSGRFTTRNQTLWSSWVIAGRDHRVFYTGDSGYFDGYARIGAEHGPFDATLIQIGAYDPRWPDVHMTPEQGVEAHRDLRGDLLLPVHWATFNLAAHAWSDPVDRLWTAAKARDVSLAVPRPGERVAVAEPPAVDGWWQLLV